MDKHSGCCSACYGRQGTKAGGGVYCSDESCSCHSDPSEISDGYHTFKELYRHRNLLFIALCRQFNNFEMFGWRQIGIENPNQRQVWRSKFHSDGSSYDGWFILGLNRDKGRQITYHLPDDMWELTSFAQTLDRGPEWDGHTPDDVLERLEKLSTGKPLSTSR